MRGVSKSRWIKSRWIKSRWIKSRWIKSRWIRALVSRVAATLICGLASACAPHLWLQEAHFLSHEGELSAALERYEDSLLSGRSSDGVYQKAELVLESMIAQKIGHIEKLRDRVSLSDLCAALLDLERLSPLAIDQLQLSAFGLIGVSPIVTQTSPQHLLKHLSSLERQSRCPVAGLWVNEWRLTSSLEIALKSLETSELSIEQLSFFSQFLETLRPLSAPHSLSHELSHAIQQERDHYWRKLIIELIDQRSWGLAWAYHRLASRTQKFSNVPWLASSMMYEVIDDELDWTLNRLLQETSSISPSSLSTSLYTYFNEDPLASAWLKHSSPVQSSKKNSSFGGERGETYQSLLSGESLSLTFIEEKLKCDFTKTKVSREIRYEEPEGRVLSPQYVSQLKRVETSQAAYEEAQSELEELERSLLVAQADLEEFTAQKLKGVQRKAKRQGERFTQLLKSRDRHLIKINKRREEYHWGPPPPSLTKEIIMLQESLSPLVKQIEQLTIGLEITQSALEDTQSRQLKRREEVTRLSGYLVKTVARMDKAALRLDEREEHLKGLPKFQQSSSQSVFRYPAIEETMSCSLGISARSSTAPTQVLWTGEERLSTQYLIHRSYPKYGVKPLKSAQKESRRELLGRGRALLVRRAHRWLKQSSIARLIERGKTLLKDESVSLSDESVSLSDESIALLTYLSPEPFLKHLTERLRNRLDLNVPLLALQAPLATPSPLSPY